jgi:predicted aspartyl protease
VSGVQAPLPFHSLLVEAHLPCAGREHILGHRADAMIFLIVPWATMLAATPVDPAPAAGPRYESVSTPQPGDATPPEQVRFAGDSYERMTVSVRVGAAGPFRFLVDTGSDRTAVSRQLAARLGLPPAAKAQLHSATGQSEVAMVVVDELTLSHKTLRRIEAPVFDAADIGADGILGIDSLRAEHLLFDFAARTLSIAAEARLPDEAGTIVVRARRKEGRLVVTDAAADGQHVSVVIDTGSQLTVGNLALRDALLARGRYEFLRPIDLVSVTGQSLRGELGVVREIRIGGASLTGLGIVFADAHTFHQLGLDAAPAILLGMNGLRGFDKVSIDFAAKKLRLVVAKSTAGASAAAPR